mmetsp:Transcript_12096/g.21575  ORF Transcript_12096/g.21575 Transcript_12096/m.21575 type:complete len:150 (+) Transcript_12096:38-487(+)
MAEETQCTAAWRDGAGFDAPSMIVGSVAGALISAALFGWVMRWRGSRQGKAAPAPSATSAKNGGSGTLELLDSDLESGGSEDEEEEEEEEDIALLRMIRVAQRAARTEGKRQPPSRGANPMLESILSAKKARLEIEEEQGGLLESTPWD